MSNILDNFLDSDNSDSEDLSVEGGPKLLKLLFNEAKSKFEFAYAQAFIEAPAKLLQTMGVPLGKATKDLCKQMALTDPEVKASKKELERIHRQLLEAQIEEGDSDKESSSSLAEKVLAETYLPLFEASGLDTLMAIRSEIDVISNNLSLHTQSIDQMAGEFKRSFWVREVQENVTIYKNQLTDYQHILIKIMRSLTNRHAISEVKYDLDHVKNVRDDCISLLKLVENQIWT